MNLKKLAKCSLAIALISGGVSFVTGCQTDPDYKKWAEENGYVKKESSIGGYEFSYIIDYTLKVPNVISACSPYADDYFGLETMCRDAAKTNLIVISDTEMEFGVKNENTPGKVFHFVKNEMGYLICTDEETPLNGSEYLIEDNKVFIKGYTYVDGLPKKSITIVFTKK